MSQLLINMTIVYIYLCNGVYIYLGYLYNMRKEQTAITNCRLVILKTLAYIMIYINFMSVFVLYFTASSSVTTGFCKFYYYFQKQVLYELFSFFDNFSHKIFFFTPNYNFPHSYCGRFLLRWEESLYKLKHWQNISIAILFRFINCFVYFDEIFFRCSNYILISWIFVTFWHNLKAIF